MKRPSKGLQILLAVALLLYACGYVTQFIGNYAVWQKNGGMLGGTSPPFPSLTPLACLKGICGFRTAFTVWQAAQQQSLQLSCIESCSAKMP